MDALANATNAYRGVLMTRDQLNEWTSKVFVGTEGHYEATKEDTYTFRNLASVNLDYNLSLDYMSKVMES